MPLFTGRKTTTPAEELSFDARLALVGPNMDARLHGAGLTHNVNAASAETVVDYADVITGPVAMPQTPITPYRTPVAALFQRARQRIEERGWSRKSLRGEKGSVCVYGAIKAEARSSREERQALEVLTEAIRRDFGDFDTIPSWNYRQRDSRAVFRVLDSAASLADARGL